MSIILYPPSHTHTCKAYLIPILLHDHCAICAPAFTPLVYAIPYAILVMAILVMAISCKGQT